MDMDNERVQHQRELGRIRAARHYLKHKDQVKLKVKGEYESRKQDILEEIRIRWQPERERAMGSKCYIVLNERQSKYRQCGLCFHYANLKHTELISPFGNIISRTFCPYCRRQSERVLYELS